MNLFSIGILLLLSTTSLTAQCHYEINRTDKFTNELERLTEAIVIARKVKRNNALPLRKVLLQFKNFNNYKTIVLKFPLTAVMSPTFNDDKSDSHLVVLLENNTKLKLPMATLMSNQAESVELRYAIDFELDKASINQLKKSNITDIRVAMKVNTFDIGVEKNTAVLLRKKIACID